MPGSTVSVREEKLVLATYPALSPDPNPMFFDKRAVQGAKGNIYPMPFTNRLSCEKKDRAYTALYLENEYVELVMLPELGGRIFAGRDRTNGYDFFYRHTVIKPALIGLAGPWISGGLEFNWPQHHRASTFQPVDYIVEQHPDGSATVWMGEHEPLERTKGMVGVCLYPGKNLVETKVRLYNRTGLARTFLWWSNAAVHINPRYQVIFPPDVTYVQFHNKTAVTGYPLAKGQYSCMDYGEGTDISWYANSPFPVSFFAGESRYDFFGGYDHQRNAGVIHVADRNISPGKKFFTWANGPFGHQWQRNLMDDEGEYLELMAGVFSDNQPDFSWIMPYETKTFSEFWYPVQAVGVTKNANLNAAVGLTLEAGRARLAVSPTAVFPKARVTLAGPEGLVADQRADLKPGWPFSAEVNLAAGISETDLELRLTAADGTELISYRPEPPETKTWPAAREPLADPETLDSVEKLYLTGLHIEQYRHPVRPAEPYWEEGLKRDPEDSRCHLALGRATLRQGRFDAAAEHLDRAIRRLTWHNPNPPDGETHYHLGLARQYQGRTEEAYQALGKAAWSLAWRSAAHYAQAQIDCRRLNWTKALELVERSLAVNTQHLQARNLKTAILRRQKNYPAARALAEATLALDRLDFQSRYELVLLHREQGHQAEANTALAELKRLVRGEAGTGLDVAWDYADAGLWEEAGGVLSDIGLTDQRHPMVAYTLGFFAQAAGDKLARDRWYAKGAEAPPDYCFPWRWQELVVLKDVLAANPRDSRAHYYLGNLLFDKHRPAEAAEHWQASVRAEPGLAVVWRNLGLAAYNIERDLDKAQDCFEKACTAAPEEGRIRFEYDQLLKRRACPPAQRLERLLAVEQVVRQREDLSLETALLHNCLGAPDKALKILQQHSFHPWEGGEGHAAACYLDAHWLLGRKALDAGDPKAALAWFEKGMILPDNLGEAPYSQANAHLRYYAGLARLALGQTDKAEEIFEELVSLKSNWFSTKEFTTLDYYQCLALQKLDREPEAEEKLTAMLARVKELAGTVPKFYQFLPNPVFEDDLKTLNQVRYTYLAGLAQLGLGDKQAAKESFRRVLKLDPSHLGAGEEMKRLGK